jgi:hypothetical protein
VVRTAVVTVSATGATPQTVMVTQSINTAIQQSNEAKIRVYPNPFDEGFWVTDLHTQAVMKLTDITGRMLLIRETGNDSYIPSAGLAPGIYLLQVCTAGVCREWKLVKQ